MNKTVLLAVGLLIVGCRNANIVRGVNVIRGPELVGNYAFVGGPSGKWDGVEVPAGTGGVISLRSDGTAEVKEIPRFEAGFGHIEWTMVTGIGQWRAVNVKTDGSDHWTVQIDTPAVGLIFVLYKRADGFDLAIWGDPDMSEPFIYRGVSQR